MSRSYRIAVSGSVDRIVHVDDGVCTSLELLPILPKERMSEHLADELVRRGFTRDGKTARRPMKDGVVVEVDVETGAVTVRVSREVAVEAEAERTTHVADRASPEVVAAAKRKLEVELQASLEKEALRQTEQGRREATAKLEARLRDLKQELDGVVNRVTGHALKEKARTMGEIQEIVEDEKTGALTIKVKL